MSLSWKQPKDNQELLIASKTGFQNLTWKRPHSLPAGMKLLSADSGMKKGGKMGEANKT